MTSGGHAAVDPNKRIKSVSIWFYIIAAFQAVAAYITWSSGSSDAGLAAATLVLTAVDVVIGVLFVVLGYYAGKKQTWAFVAGLVLYALRAAIQLFEGFSLVAILIRVYLMFRIFQGLQACVAVNQSEAATKQLLSPRRLEMPQMSALSATPPPTPPAQVPQAWVPPRVAASEGTESK
jgi:hypothetical protein